MFALAVFSMSSFVACKDYDEDSYDDLKARINKEVDLRKAIEKQIEELWKAIDTYKCKCDPSKYASQADFEKAKNQLNNLQKTVDSLKNASGGPGRDTTIYIENPYNDEWIKIRLNNVSDSLKMLNALNSWLVYVENLAKQDSIRIDSLRDAIAGWDETLKNLNYRVDSIVQHMTHDTIYVGGCDSACKAKIAEAKATADSALKLSEKALLLAQKNSNRIDSLEQYVSQVVKFIKEEVSLLNNRIDLLLDNMVTGVIIQGTECPVIGYFNTPLDVRSQMLAAYYGIVDNKVNFPSTKTADYVDVSEFWTERNVEVMGMSPANAEGKSTLEGTFVSQKNGSEEGNAGTLYLTVNPTSVNFEGKVLTLESSKGETAGISLSKLKKSDRELTFGFTRANNGFYEANATLTVDNVDKAKVRIDYKDLEDEAKTMLKEKTKTSVLSFGAALLSSMKDVMPAYAVKASWTSPKNTYNYTQKDYDVYSQYGLAATAVKPFSYAFLKDLNVNLPGEQKIIDLLDQIIDKININIDLNLPDFSKYQGAITFKDITLPTIADNTFRFTFNYSITNNFTDTEGNPVYIVITNSTGEFGFKGQNGNIWWINPVTHVFEEAPADYQRRFDVFTKDLTIDIDINKTPEIKSLLQDIIDDLNKNYGANSDLAKTISDLLNDVASLGDIDTKINDAITDAKNDLKTQLQGYVTKAYNKLNGIFSKYPNKALQPVLIGKSNGKIGILSKSKKNPTKVNSTSLTLVPTSYTLELFAPAYKKFVAVTDVWDAAGNPAAASIGKAANGDNMLKVIDSEKTCTMNGQAGYTYEIAYSAVDYHGKVVIKRFYVKF
jgi:cell division septum initiation protein DivIVA